MNFFETIISKTSLKVTLKQKPSYHLPIIAIKMGGGFNKRDPNDIKRIRQHPQVMEIFRNHQWLSLFELLKCFDEEIAREFVVALQSH